MNLLNLCKDHLLELFSDLVGNKRLHKIPEFLTRIFFLFSQIINFKRRVRPTPLKISFVLFSFFFLLSDFCYNFRRTGGGSNRSLIFLFSVSSSNRGSHGCYSQAQ